MRRATHLLLLAALATLAAGRGLQAQDQPNPGILALEIVPAKVPPKSGYRLPVSIALKNVGKRPLLVNARLRVGRAERSEVALKLVGPDLRPLRFQLLPSYAGPSQKWRVLKPGESISTLFDLAFGFELSRKGFYAVQAVYRNRQGAPKGKFELSAWKGLVASRVLRFHRG